MREQLVNLVHRFLKGEVMRRIFWNSSWLFVDRAIRMGFGLVVGVWIARYLGPAEFGLLNYSQAIVALVTILASLGLERIVVRDLVLEPEAKGEILATALTLRVVGGLVAWGASVGLALVLNPASPRIWGLVAILGGGILAQAADVVDYWYQSRTESKYPVLAKNGAFLVTVLLRVGLILAKAPLVWFAAALTLELALAALALVLVYRGTGGTFLGWRPRRLRAGRLLRESWPLILSGLAVMLYMRIDQLMLQRLSGEAAVGIYSAAVRISEVWYFVPVAIVASAAPAIVEGKQLGEAVYRQRNMKLFRSLVALSLGVSVLLSLASGLIVRRLFGEAYAAAGPVLAIHAWTSVFVALAIAQGPWMVAEGFTMMALRRALAGALVNTVLNLLFIPKYGFLAAAFNTLVAQAFAATVVNVFSARSRPIFYMQLRALRFWRA
jgi:PST family polysaccharide transporter